MIRNSSVETFNKSIVNRADKSTLIDALAETLKTNAITADVFQTYDPSFSKQIYYAIGRRSDFAFSEKRLHSIMNTVHYNLQVAA